MSGLSECRKIVKELDTGNNNESLLLPGFRFHPTEEELVGFYLQRMVEGKGVPESLIPLVEFYRHDPWDLPQMAPVTENVWFFFVLRDRKYPNGARPNRVTASGYWKATGTDRKVAQRGHCIGLKKTLVFYRGRAPKGTKTNWIMNEFRLPHTDSPNAPVKVDVALCRVYKKAASNEYKHSIAMQREAQATTVKDEYPSAGTGSSITTTDEASGLEQLLVDDNSAMQLPWLDDEVQSYNNSIVDGDASATGSHKAGMQLEIPAKGDYWQQSSPGLFVTPTSMEGLLTAAVPPCLESGNHPEWQTISPH